MIVRLLLLVEVLQVEFFLLWSCCWLLVVRVLVVLARVAVDPVAMLVLIVLAVWVLILIVAVVLVVVCHIFSFSLLFQ